MAPVDDKSPEELHNRHRWKTAGLAAAETALRRSLIIQDNERVRSLLEHVVRDRRANPESDRSYSRPAAGGDA
jgi:hypothetical protein